MLNWAVSRWGPTWILYKCFSTGLENKPQSDKTSFYGSLIFQTSGLTSKEVLTIPVKTCAVLKSLSKNFDLHKVNDLIGGLQSQSSSFSHRSCSRWRQHSPVPVLSCMEPELNLTARNQPFQPQRLCHVNKKPSLNRTSIKWQTRMGVSAQEETNSEHWWMRGYTDTLHNIWREHKTGLVKILEHKSHYMSMENKPVDVSRDGWTDNRIT